MVAFGHRTHRIRRFLKDSSFLPISKHNQISLPFRLEPAFFSSSLKLAQLGKNVKLVLL